MVEELLITGALAVSQGLENRRPVRIKIIGVGDGGCNCVRQMLQYSRVPGLDFAMVDSKVQPLETCKVDVAQIQIGEKSTRGWASSGDLKLSGRAATELAAGLRDAMSNAELVVVTAGMGGGTGTGAAPHVASLAREAGAVVIGLITTPFTFEGVRHRGHALKGVSRLRPFVDNLIVIHNDRLLNFVDQDASMADAFRTADDVVTQGVMSVSRLINVAGEFRVDFEEVKSVLGLPGDAFMAIGSGSGSMGPVEAAQQAIAHPLLDRSIKGARGVLLNVQGGKYLNQAGANAAGELISDSIGNDADILFSMSVDESLGDEVKLTLIATGLEDNLSRNPEGGKSRIRPPYLGGLWGRGKT